MTMRDMGMVSGFLVIARFVVFRSHLMMVGCVLMVLGGFPVMFGGLLGHLRFAPWPRVFRLQASLNLHTLHDAFITAL
jgi:hypothetical protein